LAAARDTANVSHVGVLRAFERLFPSRKSVSVIQSSADEHAGTQDHPFTWNVFHEMNHRASPQPRVGTRRAWHCLVLLLLPALSPSGALALPRRLVVMTSATPVADPTPYLPALGAPALRFEERPAPPAVAPRSTAPVVGPVAGTLSPFPYTAPSIASAVSTAGDTSVAGAKTEPMAPPPKTAAPILADDARPVVRPEDFIPYFQLPGSARQAGDVTLLVPVPKAPPAAGTLPPSSATYTQSPK
jgi:hypothetical protein